jgi:hypothetical protein
VKLRLALLLPMLILLTACASAPKPVPVLAVCPKVPPLVLDVPERDWLAQMQAFLLGTPPMQPDYSLPSGSVKLPTIR